MADFRPFAALRYDVAVAGDSSSLIAPPYDVVSETERAEMYRRGPFNVSLVDYGEEEPGDDAADNKYTRAKEDLDAWRRLGVLKRDPQPRFYVYDQEFELHGKRHRRRAVFGALRLEEWDKGIILPHEYTRPRDKADRFDLLTATRVHLSPIMAMYRSEPAARTIGSAAIEQPVFDAVLRGERHTLRPMTPPAAEQFREAIARERLYVADGHHRYEVALAYRDERRSAAAQWTGGEPENFVLAALVDANDPELIVLPTHRLLKLNDGSSDRLARLRELASIIEIAAGDGAADRLIQMLASAGQNRTAYGAMGLEPGKMHLVTVEDRAAVDAKLPQDRSASWRALDVAVLHHALLPAVGFEETPDSVSFIEDAKQALEEVDAGKWDAALLLNPTRIDQVIAVAAAGERMPQKSTFFYPKLATGVVMMPLD